MFRAGDEDTICALSTPPGTGGIAVLRVSGPRAVQITRKLCSFLPEAPQSHRVHYGILHALDDQSSLDEVLLTYFANGRSFTGEETVEISCHGGSVVAGSILAELVGAGCRMAQPGEFTYRAFMNGRIDLVQAESVLGLIESRSKQAAKVSLRQLQGHLSSDFAKIEDGLVWMLAHLEASIDFSTEDIEVVSAPELMARAQGIQGMVEKLLESYRQGRILRDGLRVALIGSPNAGKSSLLNVFVGEERAIVTPHAGTTRDTIEGQISIHGIPVTFVDTAGIRETENEIEKIGIERSRKAMTNADLVLFIVDLSANSMPQELEDCLSRKRFDAHYLLNKSDLDPRREKESQAREILGSKGVGSEQIHVVSARLGSGIESVIQVLRAYGQNLSSESSSVVTQARHSELLKKIHSCLQSALGLIKGNSSPEFIAFELQDAVRAVHELLGKEFDEQVIDRIFKEFCLGK